MACRMVSNDHSTSLIWLRIIRSRQQPAHLHAARDSTRRFHQLAVRCFSPSRQQTRWSLSQYVKLRASASSYSQLVADCFVAPSQYRWSNYWYWCPLNRFFHHQTLAGTPRSSHHGSRYYLARCLGSWHFHHTFVRSLQKQSY